MDNNSLSHTTWNCKYRIVFAPKYTANRNIVTYKKLYEFEKRLGDRLFYRCHQGYLVNLDYVERVQEDSLILKEKVTIPVSNPKRKNC